MFHLISKGNQGYFIGRMRAGQECQLMVDSSLYTLGDGINNI